MSEKEASSRQDKKVADISEPEKIENVLQPIVKNKIVHINNIEQSS